MVDPHRAPDPDLVSFVPTVTDSRAFTIGLWGSEVVLFALLVAGFTVLRPIGGLLNVVIACGGLAWFVAFYAIVLRGRLRPLPRPLARVSAVVAVAVFAAWFVVVVVAIAAASGPELSALAALDVAGFVLGQAALVCAYRARMFRWRADFGEP